MFKFSVTHTTGYTAEVSIPEDSSIEETIEVFRAFLLVAGFSPKTVKDALGE